MAKTDQGTRVVYKKKGGCGSFLGGFFFAIIFIVGTIAGAGFWAYNSLTTRQIESWTGIDLPVEGSIKDKPIKELIKYGIELANGYVNVTIDDLEAKYGVKLPQEIPGTDISLTPIYDATISFLGKTTKIKKIKILDIANHIDEFMTVAKEAVMDNIYVSDILAIANLDVSEFGYPILADNDFFNVGTDASPVLVGFNDLSVNQAIKMLPKLFSSDALTYGAVERMLGLSLLPAAPEIGVDPYDYIRNTPVVGFTIPELMENVTFGIVLDLLHMDEVGLDLAADFAFMNTTEFRNTKLADALSYVKTSLKLSYIIDVPATLADADTAIDRILWALGDFVVGSVIDSDPMQAIADQFGATGLTVGMLIPLSSCVDPAVLDELDAEYKPYLAPFGAVALSELKEVLLYTPIGEMLSPTQKAQTALSISDFDLTIVELLENNQPDDLATILAGLNLSGLGYLHALASSTDATIISDIDNMTLAEFAGINLGIFANLADLNLGDLLTSADILKTVVDELGGDTPITQLFNISAGSGGAFALLDSLTINSLLNGTAGTVITDALNSSSIGDLLGEDSATGLLGLLIDVDIADLMGGAASQVLTDALQAATISDLFNGVVPSVLSDLASSTIGNIATDFNNIKLSSILPAGTGNGVVDALRANTTATVGNIDTAIEALTVDQVFGSSRTGMLALLSGSAQVLALTDADFDLDNQTIGTLKTLGIISSLVDARLDLYTFAQVSGVLQNTTVADAIITALGGTP